MKRETTNQPWNLESFLDSLIVELDKAQDTLAVKGVTRRLTYMVRDCAIELMVVPQYDGERIQFTTARPGDAGASKLSIQLGSITDRQIKDHSKDPLSSDDLPIDSIEGLDSTVRESLKKVGVRSARDVQRLEQRNVDVDSVVKVKAGDGAVNYSDLANLINRARRRKDSPKVFAVSLEEQHGRTVMVVEGENLALPETRLSGALATQDARFPLAELGAMPLRVISADQRSVRLEVPEEGVAEGPQRLRLALDPYAVITMEIVP